MKRQSSERGHPRRPSTSSRSGRTKGQGRGFLRQRAGIAGSGFPRRPGPVRREVMRAAPAPDAHSRRFGRPARSSNSRSLLPEPAALARCSAVGSTPRNDSATNRRRRLPPTSGCKNYPRLRVRIYTRSAGPRACMNDTSMVVIYRREPSPRPAIVFATSPAKQPFSLLTMSGR